MAENMMMKQLGMTVETAASDKDSAELDSGNKNTTEESVETGKEKLAKERDSYIAMLKPDAAPVMAQAYKMLFDTFINKCETDQGYDALVSQPQKSWAKAMKYAEEQVKASLNPTDEQKRLARAGQPIMAPVDMDTMVSYIDAYYHVDDKEEYEKQLKLEQERKARLSKTTKPAKSASKISKEVKSTTHSNKKNVCEQLSFDLLMAE